MSLMEILVVLAIIGLVSGVIAVAVIGHLDKARITTSRESARVLRNAVSSYRMARSGDECPTVEMLVADQEIDRASKTIDAWDKPFRIECDERSGVTVVSSGPDKKLGTPDDIRVPDPPAVAQTP
jgi:type II secretory pathway pseudopilin PulG